MFPATSRTGFVRRCFG